MDKLKTVTISESKYQKLLKDSEILNALYGAGVDNWEGYGEALGSLGDDERPIFPPNTYHTEASSKVE